LPPFFKQKAIESAAIRDYTKGWAVGLVLTAFSMAEEGDAFIDQMEPMAEFEITAECRGLISAGRREYRRLQLRLRQGPRCGGTLLN
jgi:hypothetical protein